MKTHGSKFVRILYNPDGSPVRRAEPKVRLSKKKCHKLRQEGREAVKREEE